MDTKGNSNCRISELQDESKIGTKVSLSGWVRTRRDSKEVSFLVVNDGSDVQGLQVVIDSDIEGFAEASSHCKNGAAVCITGTLVESPGKGQKVELQAESFELVGGCIAEDYPLQKKRHTNEFLRTIPHLRPRTNTFGAAFRIRSEASFAIHSFFNQEGFSYIHTPIITTSDCEGAGKMFQVTTLNQDNIPKLDSKKVDYSKDFFGQEAHLTVSGQLEAEMFACSLKKAYTFGPVFRAENSNTPRHLAEFWMVEPEMAFCDLAGNMEVAERFIKFTIGHVLEKCQSDMAFFNQWVEKGIVDSLESVVTADFARITYDEAIKVLEKSKQKFEFPVAWGNDLQTEHERYLTEEHIKGPVFVTNYPTEIKAFYMYLDEGEKTVSAMDLLVPRLGEIIGGSMREHREDILLKQLDKFNVPREHIEWYLDLRKYGTNPHSGFGLGFERLVMYLTGLKNIRDVIPCPRTPGNASI